MGRRKNPKMKIMQRSIGFKFYQMEFFANYPDFQPDKYCRQAIDEQIKLVDPKFIPAEED